MKYLRPTPKRTAVVAAIRQLYTTERPIENVGCFFARELAEFTDLTVSAISAVLTDLFRAEHIVREVHRQERNIIMYRYRATPALLEPVQDNHVVADKLLLLQGLRSTMAGRAAAVMDSIINDYEENYGRT